MLDVDNFSRINDTQGQAVGDVLLKEVAHRLQNCLRDSQRSVDRADDSAEKIDINDWVARTGGDEFALALPGISTAEAAQAVAQRVQLALARPFVFAQQEIPLSATMGISLFPGDAATAGALIKNADAAMHHGKKTGHGGLEFFNKSISTRAAKHLSMEADLRKALERGEFTLNYQPRLALKDLRVEAVEALLRWRHPQRGFVAPDEFIPLAEQSGLIVEIGDWVLREACAQARRWRDAGGPGWQVAVNVSGVQFRDGSLVSRVSHAIDAAGIDSRMIELEFTEGALIEYSAAVSKAVKSLKELGVATALDDFGTGYSSLSYLRHFPIDTLKIDRVFVRDIASKNGGNAPLVDAIIAMAKSLGLATVAEGVETEAQWQYLKTRDANQVQGFLFCRPLAIEDLGALARRLAACQSVQVGKPRLGICVRSYGLRYFRVRRQITSVPCSWRASTRASTNKRSDRRFRYLSASGDTLSVRASDQQRRSARRHTARATWQAAAAGPPPGSMNSFRGGKVSLNSSNTVSSRSTCAASIMRCPGMHNSPPRSNRSCWTSVRQPAMSGGSAATPSTTPIALLASSTVP